MAIRTPESRRKMSIAMQGNKNALGAKRSEETKKRMRDAAKRRKKVSGWKLSEETKRRMSIAQTGRTRKGHACPESLKRKLSEQRKGAGNPMFGKTHTPEYKKELSVRFTGNQYAKGKTPWNKGIPTTEEVKHKMSIVKTGKPNHSLKGRRRPDMAGENNLNWKGGLSRDKREYTKIYKHKRRARKAGNGGSYTVEQWEMVKKIYNYTCPACGKVEPKIKLTQDHIIPIVRGGSNNIENIQPLCKSCNSKKYTNIVRYEPICIIAA